MEGYIKALIDTHRRRLKNSSFPNEKEEIKDRIEELEGILEYCEQRSEKIEHKFSGFLTSCKAKDLSEEIRKKCEG
ncbi:hypothetical protein NSA50_18425 [Clostridium sp. DSM 100503]|uniref:hypothetical protein n=1 Tax=Clostridium sp. DSM 100503 TaxID=2963282 RepID=UPI00214A49F5|nr:hypothetical protein [Clostridium sp. DSM 100503]MCR1952979.1 hypothetical protein [Clostridium sp. DSM 100503]